MYIDNDFSTCVSGLKPKDLCGIPWRLAFALQADGWYLRSDIIWAKPNPMPESVSGCAWERHRVKIKIGGNTGKIIGGVEHWNSGGVNLRETEWADCPGCPKCEPNDGYVLSWNAGRPTKAHEYIFLLTKSPKYFFDQEAVREAHSPDGRKDTEFKGSAKYANGFGPTTNSSSLVGHERWPGSGRNIRTVWNIATQPFSGAHFATFPEELVRKCLFAGTSEKGCCPKCGGPWVRVVENKPATSKECPKTVEAHYARGGVGNPVGTVGKSGSGRIEGYTKTLAWRPSCECGEERTVPAIVLDPFFGAGTVGVVAQKYNRRFIGLELKPEYCQMARKRVNSQPVAML